MVRTRRSTARRDIKRRRKRILQSRDLETLTNPQINMKSRSWRKLQRAREWCEWYDEQQRHHKPRKRSFNVILLYAGVIDIFSPTAFWLFASRKARLVNAVARLVNAVVNHEEFDKHVQARLDSRAH